MENIIKRTGFIVILFMVVSIISCERTSPPLMGTSRVTDITLYTAVVKGYVITDGGSPVTSKGICWGTEPNPTISNNMLEIPRGYIWRYIGNLIPSTTYYVRGYASNKTGLAYGSQQVFKTYNDSVMDIDNNIYYTILFGNKEWMGSNLKVTRYNNGDPVETTALPWTTIESETEPKYQWACDGTESIVINYGRLYTWHAASDIRKLCPEGWHLPTDEEWTDLINQLGGESVAGGKMKFDPRYWNYNNVTNSQDGGFDAPGAGMREPAGTFLNLGLSTVFWSSSSSSAADAFSRRIDVSTTLVIRAASNKSSGFSVRCVKD